MKMILGRGLDAPNGDAYGCVLHSLYFFMLEGEI